MGLTKGAWVINTIQSLSNKVVGQATALKVAFDKAASDIKTYINSTLTAELDILDAANVKLTGAQEVAGVKTLTSSPIVPTPTTDYQAATKKYVDDTDTTQTGSLTTHKSSSDHDGRYYTETETDLFAVKLTGDQGIAGTKTFSSSPIVPTPTTATQAASKSYVDDNFVTQTNLATTRKLSESGDFTGTLDGNAITAAEPGLSSAFNALVANIAKSFLYGAMEGILPANDDNHDVIIAACDKLQANGGGTLWLPYGTLKTTPISFQGYDGIVIRGTGGSFPAVVNTTIKIIGTYASGSVGLQFCDTKNPKTTIEDTWSATGCKLIGIYLDCDDKCDTGINGNRELVFEDVTVRNAVADGIVFEDYTYPITMRNVNSSFNGRHGLYVRGNSSTVYWLDKCEFGSNTGYGINIEGGAGASFKDVTVQSNVQGGVKINRVTGVNFLSSIIFDNLYTESNGTLDPADPDYEENCTVYLTGSDKTSASTGKPTSIWFKNGKINAISGGISIKADALWGCKVDAVVNGTLSINTATGVYGLEFGTAPTAASLPSVGASSLAVASYYRVDTPKGIVYDGGLFPSRGRMQIYEFYLPTISGSTTDYMSTLYQLTGISLGRGYSMIKDGSIIGVRIIKKGSGGSGTITFRPTYYAGPDLTIDPPNAISGSANLTITLSATYYVSAFYDPGTIKFSSGHQIGIKVTSSSGYSGGTYDGYIGQLMVEI